MMRDLKAAHEAAARIFFAGFAAWSRSHHNPARPRFVAAAFLSSFFAVLAARPQTSIAEPSDNAIVGAAINDAGTQTVCVLVDSTHIQCTLGDDTYGWYWCPSHTLSNGRSTWLPFATGIYLVDNFNYNSLLGSIANVAFLSAYDPNTSRWGVLRLQITPANDCVASEDFYTFLDIANGEHPDAGTFLGVSNDPGNNSVYVFAIDGRGVNGAANIGGSLLGVRYDNYGTGSAHSQYSLNTEGVLNDRNLLNALGSAPIAAAPCDTPAGPICVVASNTQNRAPRVIYGQEGGWDHQVATNLVNDHLGAALANVYVPSFDVIDSMTGVHTTYFNSFFYVDTLDNVLFEHSLTYNQQTHAFAVTSRSQHPYVSGSPDSSALGLSGVTLLDQSAGYVSSVFSSTDTTHAYFFSGWQSGGSWATYLGAPTLVGPVTFDVLGLQKAIRRGALNSGDTGLVFTVCRDHNMVPSRWICVIDTWNGYVGYTSGCVGNGGHCPFGNF